jgi:hypothetical protein
MVNLIDGNDNVVVGSVKNIYQSQLVIAGGNGNDDYTLVSDDTGLSSLTASNIYVVDSMAANQRNILTVNLGIQMTSTACHVACLSIHQRCV